MPSAQHLYRIGQEAMSNAARHSRASRITVVLEGDNGELTLRVEDNGVGLPLDRRAAGMGLRSMGYRASPISATLAVASGPGGGTRVTCRVPRPPAAPASPESTGGVMDSGLTGTARIRALLVDDHPAVRQGLALLLASDGIDPEAEASGRAEALSRAEARRLHLAIVDLTLDAEDGAALIGDLRARNIPVLAYSMHKDPRHVEGAFVAGALGYVAKRKLHEVLVQAIQEVAAGRRTARAQALQGEDPCHRDTMPPAPWAAACASAPA